MLQCYYIICLYGKGGLEKRTQTLKHKFKNILSDQFKGHCALRFRNNEGLIYREVINRGVVVSTIRTYHKNNQQ